MCISLNYSISHNLYDCECTVAVFLCARTHKRLMHLAHTHVALMLVLFVDDVMGCESCTLSCGRPGRTGQTILTTRFSLTTHALRHTELHEHFTSRSTKPTQDEARSSPRLRLPLSFSNHFLCVCVSHCFACHWRKIHIDGQIMLIQFGFIVPINRTPGHWPCAGGRSMLTLMI